MSRNAPLGADLQPVSCFAKAKEKTLCQFETIGNRWQKGRMLLPSNFNYHFLIFKNFVVLVIPNAISNQ